MEATIMSGKPVAEKILHSVARRAAEFFDKSGRKAKLSVILVGADPASQIYVARKHKNCIESGLDSEIIKMPETTSQEELLTAIARLNADDGVDGVLVQLPLPAHISERAVIAAICPSKDVDGFHAINSGNLFSGYHSFVSCTPAGVMEMLKYYGIDPSGKHAVVIGRSNIVGKPMAMLLLQANATVTICHSKTRNIEEITRQGDIVVVAVGQPGYLTENMVKKDAVVVDVGINRCDGKVTGDCAFGTLSGKCSAITPVPGGVGILTPAMLLSNTLDAAEQRLNGIATK